MRTVSAKKRAQDARATLRAVQLERRIALLENRVTILATEMVKQLEFRRVVVRKVHADRAAAQARLDQAEWLIADEIARRPNP